ncbi:MAG TPA: HAD-IIA family hydrolase [Solirubrobacterales bacterium]|nr:HAD-IIA family hydrolase [Solirubrobacterales bacterium]
MPLADRFDGLLVDLDGVVWIGRDPVPGSPEALRALIQAGKPIVFVTNNPGKHPRAYAKRLGGMGVGVVPEQIVTAGMVAARLASEAAAAPGKTVRAFVIGMPALEEMVTGAGAQLLERDEAEKADVVVVSGHRGFDYRELLAAKRALDHGAALVATSRDPTMPYPGGELPGTGAVLAAVETATGRRAEIAGKPERHLFEMARQALACSSAGNSNEKEQADWRVAMVGDRLSSDIEGGRRAGLETVLVLSGTTSREQAAAADPAPDFVLEDLSGLLA